MPLSEHASVYWSAAGEEEGDDIEEVVHDVKH